MGCAQSRIDNEESVTRCKDRRNHIKDAVSSRNAFASAHTAYSVSLKNTGASLSDFSISDSFPSSSSSAAPADHSLAAPPPPPLPPHIDTLPPPPPPLPAFSPSPLKRSSTLPPDISSSPATTPLLLRGGLAGPDKSPLSIHEEDGDDEHPEVKLKNNLHRPPGLRKSDAVPAAPPPPMPESKGMVWDYFYMVENMQGSGLGGGGEVEDEDGVHGDDDDDENDVTSDVREDGGGMRMRFEGSDSIEMEFKTPEKQKIMAVQDEEDLRSEVREKEEVEVEVDGRTNAVAAAATGQNMVKVMGAIDDHFLKASECAQDVSRMLEATRMHYHSNYADDRGTAADLTPLATN